MAKFYELSKPEEKLVFYGFTVSEDGKKGICREAYADAEGVMAHLGLVGDYLNSCIQAGTMSVEQL